MLTRAARGIHISLHGPLLMGISAALVLALATGIGAAGLTPGGGLAVAAVLVLSAIPMALTVSPQTLVLATLVYAYVIDWLVLGLGVLPPQSAWLIEILIAVLLVRMAMVYRGRGLPSLHPMVWALLGMVGVAALVGAGSGTPVLVLIAGLRNHLRFVLFGIAVSLVSRDKRFENRMWATLLALGLVQVLVSLGQFLTVGAGDGVTGTLGPGMSGIQVLFLAPLSAACIVWGLAQRAVAHKVAAGVAGLFLLLPVLLSAAWGGVLAFPAAAGVALVIRQRLGPRAFMTLVLVVLAIVPAVSLGVWVAQGFYRDSSLPVARVDSIQGIMAYDRGSSAINPARLGRLRWTVDWWVAAPFPEKIAGWGPGSASPSALGPDFEGPLMGLPMVRLLSLSFARVLLETGALGLAAAVGTLLYGIRIARRVALKEQHTSAEALALLLSGMAVVMLFGFFYSDVWMQPGTAAAFWATYGYALGRCRETAS